ncbi:DUF1345 domain-containing protein [Pseudonocardia kujensis]|uniref:DUF1345 domain-containing protein n=1 Tax=Pseudonocardia kujensis TaxID=1128675 RepID=UPI001E59558D|nr:DUF1345 domain-containing protein [Pseudonocardia kujensis]MCE0768496.1 DUF1345 domain-containing protein [Pseudonocardia kujensis]
MSASDSGDPPVGHRKDEFGHQHALATIRRELTRLEADLGPDGHASHASGLPAWKRRTAGEPRWPAAVAVVVAIALQLALPDRLVPVSRWLLPGLELLVLLGLVAAGPTRLDRGSAWQRAAGLVLVGLLSLANAWSATLLVVGILSGRSGDDAGALLSSGAAIWLTNIIAFGIWYWELDRGGPVSRAHGLRHEADFEFVQMQSDDPHKREWEPRFLDYLYVSFTNATAFSPTDTMPLSRWAKMLMTLQALVSLATVALVVARAVNVLH